MFTGRDSAKWRPSWRNTSEMSALLNGNHKAFSSHRPNRYLVTASFSFYDDLTNVAKIDGRHNIKYCLLCAAARNLVPMTSPPNLLMNAPFSLGSPSSAALAFPHGAAGDGDDRAR
jgi:hypothetical protein